MRSHDDSKQKSVLCVEAILPIANYDELVMITTMGLLGHGVWPTRPPIIMQVAAPGAGTIRTNNDVEGGIIWLMYE